MRSCNWRIFWAILIFINSGLCAYSEPKPALPAGHWGRVELTRILGGLMQQETGADMAIFKPIPEFADIDGPVSFEDISKINPKGGLRTVTATGGQIRRIAKIIKDGNLELEIYGVDGKGVIGERFLGETEKVTVAVSDAALLDLHFIGAMGGFNEPFAVRAPFAEGINADLKQLFFAGGPKIIMTADTMAVVEEAFKEIPKVSFDEVFERFFAAEAQNEFAINEFLKYPYGKPHQVLTLEINYIDLGLSNNFANATYRDWEKNKKYPSTLSRGKVPALVHLFFDAKATATYDPGLNFVPIFSLAGDVKYLHTDLSKKPEKDKTKLTLRARLPLEKTYFKKSSVIISPILQEEFETQLVPNFWSRPKELTEARTKRLDSLLGINTNFKNLGFNADVGFLLASDFNRSTVRDALDMGPGLNFSGKWSIYGPLELGSTIKSYYLFALPNNTAKNKIALGVEGQVWLRVARFYDFSLSLMNDFLVATLQEAPKDFSLSSILGLTISYGRFFRLFG